MGRIARALVAQLACDEAGHNEAARQRRIEEHLYAKVDPRRSVAQNCAALRARVARLEPKVGPEARRALRVQLQRFEANMAAAMHRRAIGVDGYEAACLINNASGVAGMEAAASAYLRTKVQTRLPALQNIARISHKTDVLLSHVAPSCAPYVADARDATLAQLDTIVKEKRAAARRSGGSGSSWSTGRSGSSGWGGDSGGGCSSSGGCGGGGGG
jgi:uncharacterized membrane protein YgcG